MSWTRGKRLYSQTERKNEKRRLAYMNMSPHKKELLLAVKRAKRRAGYSSMTPDERAAFLVDINDRTGSLTSECVVGAVVADTDVASSSDVPLSCQGGTHTCHSADPLPRTGLDRDVMLPTRRYGRRRTARMAGIVPLFGCCLFSVWSTC